MRKKWLLISMAFLVITSLSFSGEPLSIGKAVKKALDYNPYLKAIEYEKQISLTKVGEAKSMKGVKVTIGVTESRMNGPLTAFGAKLNQGRIGLDDFNPSRLNDPNYTNNLQLGIQVAVPIYLSGIDHYSIKAAQSGVKVSEMELNRRREEIIFKAVEAYLNVILARESVEVAKKACLASAESLRNAQAQFEAMQAVESDVLQAKVHHSQNEENLLRMQNQYKLAQEALATIMGESSVESYFLDMPFLTQECSACHEDPKALLEKALLKRQDYRKIDEQIAVAYNMEKAARGITKPKVFLGVASEVNKKDINSDGKSNNMLFTRIDWNIADGGEAVHKAQIAKQQIEMLKNLQKSLADQIFLEIREAVTNVNNALERIRVSRIAIEQSRESLRIFRDRYNAGLAIMSDLLRAETSLKDHEMNLLKALYDYSLSRARLKYALGDLTLENCEILREP